MCIFGDWRFIFFDDIYAWDVYESDFMVYLWVAYIPRFSQVIFGKRRNTLNGKGCDVTTLSINICKITQKHHATEDI